MAQILRLNAIEGGVVVVVIHKALKGILPGDEHGFFHIVQRIDFGADASCFGIGQGGIHIHHDFAGLVQLLHHHVQVVGQNGEAAHNQQARNGNANSGKGHKAVEEDAAKTFLD